jgi:hypothetical protein
MVTPLTPASIMGCTLSKGLHGDGKDKQGRFFFNQVTIAEYPRLQRRTKVWSRRGVASQVTWIVDGEDIGTLENALAALNANPLPPVGPAEVGALLAIDDEWTIHDDQPPPIVLTLLDKGLVEVRREAGHTEYRRTELGREILGENHATSQV